MHYKTMITLIAISLASFSTACTSDNAIESNPPSDSVTDGNDEGDDDEKEDGSETSTPDENHGDGQTDETDPIAEETEPGTDTTDPETDTPDPGTDTPDPGTDTPDPGTDTPDPGTDTPDPGTDTPDPGTDTPDPGTDTPDPGTDTPDPGTDTPDPGTDTPDPGTDTPDPGTDTPDPGTDTPTPVTPPAPKPPKADLLDIAFTNNNNATNRVSNGLKISKLAQTKIINYNSPRYKMYVAHFNNTLGSKAGGCYKIDYTDNQAFQKALSDGHTLEAVFRMDAAHNGSSEAKFFSSHSSGGTGFLITKTEKGKTITFLPYVGDGYKWCDSKVVPEVGRFYHVVGVWDKSEGKAHIYIDGKHAGSVAAAGNFKFGSQSWFGIGCDAGSSSESSWNGDVAIARVYDKPLTADEVALLYNEVKQANPKHFVINSVDALGTANIAKGYKYHVYGSGFKTGDVIRFESMADTKTHATTTTIASGKATAVIPDGLATGNYRSVLVRGTDVYPLSWGKLTLTANPPTQANVNCVAHRGYHADAPDNSIASLKAAQNLGVYGSEFDVHITLDGGLFVYHDKVFTEGGKEVNLQTSKTATVKKLKLSNGEALPTLEAYLKQGQKVPSVKMVLEIKNHGKAGSYSEKENNKRVTKACIDLVKKLKMEDQVEWIAFNYDNCKQIKKALPNAVVEYLASSDSAAKTPDTLNKDGLSLDYKTTLLKSHLDWITSAHKNKQIVNVWTVAKEDFDYWIGKGVDSITTNASKALMNKSRIYVQK